LISWWCRRRCSRRLSPPPSFLVAILESWFISSYLAITPRDLGAGTEGGMMTRRLPTRGAAAALALVLLGGACTTESSDGAGGDGGDGSATAADIEVGQSTWDPDNVEVDMPELECEQTAEDPTRGVTDTEVRVGALATITGPTTSLWGDAVSGAKARL